MPPDAPLAGRAVLITGGARRIGAAVARALHEQGADLALHYRHSAEEARKLRDTLEAARPDSAMTVQADLLELDELSRIVEEVAGRFGRLDVLINNASSFYATPLGTIGPEHWDDLLGSNLKAPLFLSQAAAPWLKQAHGVIVNLVDIHAFRPLREHPVYCAAKAGLVMLTRSLAKELGPEIRVNGIAPGAIAWPESLDATVKDKILEDTALKRAGSPEDIASCVVFLVRDADYVTGQVIAVDGGRSLGW